jgi:hypothetical protein
MWPCYVLGYVLAASAAVLRGRRMHADPSTGFVSDSNNEFDSPNQFVPYDGIIEPRPTASLVPLGEGELVGVRMSCRRAEPQRGLHFFSPCVLKLLSRHQRPRRLPRVAARPPRNFPPPPIKSPNFPPAHQIWCSPLLPLRCTPPAVCCLPG